MGVADGYAERAGAYNGVVAFVVGAIWRRDH